MQLAAILCLLAVICASAFAADKAFDFHEFFDGDFSVTSVSSSVGNPTLDADEKFITQYNIAAENGTSALIGSSFNNDTTSFEVSNLQQIRISFDDESKVNGVFSVGFDEASIEPLFKFAFTSLNNGVVISQGTWGKSESYQFMIPSNDKFIITVFHTGGKTTTYAGKRIPKVVPQTFWAKYKMWFMIGGMMLFNTFIQSKTKNAMGAPGAAAPAADAPAVAAKKNN
jgi:hypothetical protein